LSVRVVVLLLDRELRVRARRGANPGAESGAAGRADGRAPPSADRRAKPGPERIEHDERAACRYLRIPRESAFICAKTFLCDAADRWLRKCWQTAMHQMRKTFPVPESSKKQAVKTSVQRY
jgi:hypothetical protein